MGYRVLYMTGLKIAEQVEFNFSKSIPFIYNKNCKIRRRPSKGGSSSEDSKLSSLHVFTDFTKPLDTVRHDILLKLLNIMGYGVLYMAALQIIEQVEFNLSKSIPFINTNTYQVRRASGECSWPDVISC